MGWNATLAVDYGRSGSRTRINRLAHEGPLQIQKSFYPDESGMVHNYVLHPPGGLVGGDRLNVRITLEDEAAVLLTTPAAGKIYRTPWQPSRFTLRGTVGPGCELNWLPLETIVYEGAHHRSEVEWVLHPQARLTTWDIQCLGRPGSGKVFDQGCLDTQVTMRSTDRILFLDRQRYEGGHVMLQKAWGLAGCAALGSMLLHWPESEFMSQYCGDQSTDDVDVGVTYRSGWLVARARAACPLRLRARFLALLQSLHAERPGSGFSMPRIWAY